MDAGKIIQMVMNMFVKKAVNSGIEIAARRGKPVKDMTPSERDQAQKGRELAKHARQFANIMRRLGR